MNTHKRKHTYALWHAPLPWLLWGSTALWQRLPAVLVAPLPVWMGSEVGLLHLKKKDTGSFLSFCKCLSVEFSRVASFTAYKNYQVFFLFLSISRHPPTAGEADLKMNVVVEPIKQLCIITWKAKSWYCCFSLGPRAYHHSPRILLTVRLSWLGCRWCTRARWRLLKIMNAFMGRRMWSFSLWLGFGRHIHAQLFKQHSVSNNLSLLCLSIFSFLLISLVSA